MSHYPSACDDLMQQQQRPRPAYRMTPPSPLLPAPAFYPEPQQQQPYACDEGGTQLALERLERRLATPWYYRWAVGIALLMLAAVVAIVGYATLGPQQKGLRHDLDLQRMRLDEIHFERRGSVPREDDATPPSETERTLRFDSLSLSSNCTAWFAAPSRVVRCTILEAPSSGEDDWWREPVAHFDLCCAGDLSRLICGLPAELAIQQNRGQAVLGIYDGAASQEMMRRPRRCALYLFFDKG